MCRPHADEHKRKQRSRDAHKRTRRRNRKRCVECGARLDTKDRLCRVHKLKQRQYDQRHRLKQLPY